MAWKTPLPKGLNFSVVPKTSHLFRPDPLRSSDATSNATGRQGSDHGGQAKSPRHDDRRQRSSADS
jgi:hypothetical protein